MTWSEQIRWNPLSNDVDETAFDDYMYECRLLCNEARQWAKGIPVSEHRQLIGWTTISDEDLFQLPPMPDWMKRLFGPPAPVRFGESGKSHTLYQWPFSWLHNNAGEHIPDDSMIIFWRDCRRKWLQATQFNNWFQDNNPIEGCLSENVEESMFELGNHSFRIKHIAKAKLLASDISAIEQLKKWITLLGDSDEIEKSSSYWEFLATYWTLLRDFSNVLSEPTVQPLSALQRAAMREYEPTRYASFSAIQNPSFGGPIDGPDAQARARALRQFTYWGMKPFVLPTGIIDDKRSGRWPSDPRLLSPSNEIRVVAALRILSFAKPSPKLTSIVESAAQTLSIRVHSGKIRGGRERSLRGAKTAIKTLAIYGAKEKIRALIPLLSDPRLANFASQLALP